jgi:hypothetical protein
MNPKSSRKSVGNILRSLLIFILAFVISAYPSQAIQNSPQNGVLTVLVDNYDDFVKLTLVNSNANFTYSTNFRNSTEIVLPYGSYVAYLEARNLTFTKRVTVSGDTILRFNLAFSSDPHMLSISYHTLIYPSGKGLEVSDLIIIKNKFNVNFEGNLTIPIPEHRNLKVVSSTLSFINYSHTAHQIIFKDLLVAENSSGQIMMEYTLPSNRFERVVEQKSSVMLFTTAEIVKMSPNLVDMGIRSFSGNNFRVIAGNVTGSYFVELRSVEGISLNPLAIAGIILVSGSIFLYFFERRGGWRF